MFAEVQAGVRKHSPDFVEGPARASLENDIKPEIEVFDLPHALQRRESGEEGPAEEPAPRAFVLGVTNALLT